MKKLLFILLLSPLAVFAQTTGPVASVGTKTQLKTMNFGTVTKVFVSDSNAFYSVCSPCTVDDVYVMQGTSGKKWKKVVTPLSTSDTSSLSSRIDSKVPQTRTITINGTTYDLSANRSWTIVGGGGEGGGDVFTVANNIFTQGQTIAVGGGTTHDVLTIPTVEDIAGFAITLDQSYVNSDGRYDNVMQWGYNHTGAGGMVNPAEAEMHLAMESHYQRFPGAPPEFEFHLETHMPSGLAQRHFSTNINKTTGNAIAFWQMDGMQWFPSGQAVDTSEAYAILNKNGSLSLRGPAAVFEMAVTSGAAFTFQPVDDGSGIVKITNTGTGTTPAIEFVSPVVFTSNTPFGGNLNHFTFNAASNDQWIAGFEANGVTKHRFGANGQVSFMGLASATGTYNILRINEAGGVSSYNFWADDYTWTGTQTFREATGNSILTVEAQGTGTGDYASYDLKNSAGVIGGLAGTSTNYNASTAYSANSVNLRGLTTGGIGIVAGNASGTIRFYTGGVASTDERLRLNVNGTLNAAADYSASYTDLSYITRGYLNTRLGSAYSAETAQDDVAGMFNATEFTYNDAAATVVIGTIAQSKITNLGSALAAKADLVGGIVPVDQLPASVVGIVTAANFAALPGTGTSNTIYITTNDNKRWVWTGTQYVELVTGSAVTSVNGETAAVTLDAADVGAVPTTRTLTINGTALDLSANRSFSVGTVTGLSVSSANGFSGSFTSTTTPALTIGTTITGILKGNGSAISAAIAADFPTLNQNTTGTAANVTGTVAIGNGGTGQTTAAAAFNALAPANTLGGLIYASGTNTYSSVAPNTTTTRKYLIETGTGSTGAAPVWGDIQAADVPTLNQNTTGTSSNITSTLATAAIPAFTGGDVTSLGGSLTLTITNLALSKLQQISTATVLGRNTAGTGPIEQLSTLPAAVMPSFTGGDVTSTAASVVLNVSNSAVINKVLTGLSLASSADITASDNIVTAFGKLQAQVDAFGAAATVDAVPTDGSGNAVSSNGTFDALALKQNLITLTTTGTSGAATFNQSTGALNIPNYAGGFTGGTLTSSLILAAGTATAGTAPIKHQSGTLLTTPEAGAEEYSGGILYFTPTASKRAVVAAEHYVTTQAATSLGSVNTAQSVFAAASDQVTLEANTTYFFEGAYYITSGTTTHTTAMLFALGTATVTSVDYTTETTSGAANAAIISTAATQTWSKKMSGVGSNVVNATNTQPETVIKFRGIWRNNAAGTMTPQIQFSAAPGGTNTVQVNSYIRFIPVGSGTAVGVGQWQ